MLGTVVLLVTEVIVKGKAGEVSRDQIIEDVKCQTEEFRFLYFRHLKAIERLS